MRTHIQSLREMLRFDAQLFAFLFRRIGSIDAALKKGAEVGIDFSVKIPAEQKAGLELWAIFAPPFRLAVPFLVNESSKDLRGHARYTRR